MSSSTPSGSLKDVCFAETVEESGRKEEGIKLSIERSATAFI